MININRYTRCGLKGKEICCPQCSYIIRIFHLVWDSCTCEKCNKLINKYDYYIVDENFRRVLFEKNLL